MIRIVNDGHDVTSCGRFFHAQAEATGNAWSPMVECEVLGATSAVVVADRSYRHSMSATRCSLSPMNGADNGTLVPQAETLYVLEHEANARHVEVESRVHTCITQRSTVPQNLELTAVFPTDERKGKLALHRRSPNVTSPERQ